MTTDVENLRQEIARLAAAVESLKSDLERAVTLADKSDELTQRHCRLLGRDLKDAFDRIINLELTVFPRLQQDVDAVYKITGEGDDKADNPLDRRDR